MNRINLLVQDYFVSTRTPELTWFFQALTSFFDFSILFFITFSIILLIIYRLKGLYYSTFFLLNVFITMFIVFVLKIIFNTERPANALIDAFGASFPSYHATISTVFFLTIIHVFKENLRGFNSKIFHFIAFLLILLVSISRVYLGVHWFSDVFFGILLGTLIHHISINIYRKDK